MRPIHYLLLLFSTVAVIIADEDVEIEGLESLVALNSPKSEENDVDTKKARLTFFDDIEVIRPLNSIEGNEPQLRYVSSPSTTIPTPTFTPASTTTVVTTVPTTTVTVPTTTIAPSTTTETIPTSTTPVSTTKAAEKKAKIEVQTQKPILIPIPFPDKEILRAIVETSEPILIQLPYLPKVSGVLTAGNSAQGNPWGTFPFPYQTVSPLTEYTVTVPPPVEIGSELDMGETSPFVPQDSNISDLPITPQSIQEKKEDGKMSPEDMERAQILMTALRAMKSEVEETLRQITEGEKTVMEETYSPAPTPPPSTTTSIPSTTTTSTPSTTRAATTTTATRKATTTTRKSTTTTTTTTHRPVTTPSTTPSTPTTSTTTTSIPATSSTSPIPSTTSTVYPSTTTRRPLPLDEVKSTEAVQVDSDEGEEKARVIPYNDAVVVVDNSATRLISSRIEGYTKTIGRVVDNDLPRVTKVYKKRPHDNSFLPIEENEFRPKKVITKKRHLIQNGEDIEVKITRRRLRKKVKKVSSSPLSSPLPSPSPSSTTPTPSTLSPLPPFTAPRRTLVPRAASQPPQFQVSPAAVVQRLQLEPPVVARAAPIFHPQLITQPQYYPPPPPPPSIPQPPLQSYQSIFADPRVQPQQQQLPLYQSQQQPQLPILRYEPVVYYRPVYGRKKREVMKRYEVLFNRKENEMRVKKGDESRFAALHSVISPSISMKKKHERVFEKKDQKITLKKVEGVEMKNNTTLQLPKSPSLRKSSFEPHSRTKRVKRGADLSEVNKELDELEKALNGNRKGPSQMGEKEERHTGLDELASELDMIKKMKGKGKKDIEEADLMEEEEDFDDEEEEEEKPEKEEEEKATPSYKKPLSTIEELKSLEDSVQVDHEQMKKHPQGELKLNKGERPKLFSHGRTLTEQLRGTVESDDYEYDAQIADSFHLPASDSELEELYHQRLRAAELAPVSPTAAPLRKRRHRTTPSQRDEVEVQAATRRRTRKRTITTTTTEIPTTTRASRRIRRPATIIPNFHPKEASSDSDSLASLPNFEEIETTTLRGRGLRRNRHTTEKTTTTTTTEIPETTTVRREGRPARILPKKESAFALPAGGNRFFYDRDSSPQVVTRSPPHAPPTLTTITPLPTLIPQQDFLPTISPAMSIDELAVLPREALLQELKRLSEQIEARLEKTQETTVLPPRDEEIVDEEDRELIEAIQNRQKNGKGQYPFEFLRERKETTTTTTTTVAPTKKEDQDPFSFALPSKQKGELLTIDDLVVSDDVNEASIGQDIDRILADVGVGDNSIGTRKRAIEAIMEYKKKKSGDSKAKKCHPTTCNDKEEKIPKDDLELVSQLQAVNIKHPLAKDGKFSLFATNKKSYYILPDGRVLVVNEQSKLARTNSGEELHLDDESTEETVPEYPPDIVPEETTTVLPTTAAPRRRTTTTTVATTKRRRTRPTTTTTPAPIGGSDYEETGFESATISIRPKIPSLPPHLPPRMPEMQKVVLPWRTTTSIPITTTTKRIYIHDGGIEPSQVSVFATPRTPAKSKIVVHKDDEKKHFPRHQGSGIARIILGATTLENELDTDAEMTREELIKYLESIDIAKTFGGKNLDEQTPNDEKFDRAVTKTVEDEYSDDIEYEDSVTEQQRKSPSSSQLNADPKSVDDIDLRKWFTIGKDNAVARSKKGDGIAESILAAASEVPDEEVAEDEFLAEESVNLFPDDFVRVLRSVAGGERVPMRMVRRLGLRLRAARLRRH